MVTRRRINRGESICGKGWRITSTWSWLRSMCTYILCVETLSIIQDLLLIPDRAGRGHVEPYVNICWVLDRDMCSRQRLCFLQRSHMSWRTEDGGSLLLILFKRNSDERGCILGQCFIKQAPNKLSILGKPWFEVNLTNGFSFKLFHNYNLELSQHSN